MTNYTLPELRHNFAVWTSARAVQRGFTTTAIIKSAIESAGLKEFVEDENAWPKTAAEFDGVHKELCHKLGDALNESLTDEATFGRCAKILAIYLKTAVILGSSNRGQPMIQFIHPPIDSILLRNIAKECPDKDKDFLKYCKEFVWTKANEGQYSELIGKLRGQGLDKHEFWEIERYWSPVKAGETKHQKLD